MKPILDAFWRAVAYCLHPRIIAFSLLPLIILVLLAGGFIYFFGADVLHWVDVWLQSNPTVQWGIATLNQMGLQMDGVGHVLPTVLMAVFSMPLFILFSLVLVTAITTPSIVSLVGERRFAKLERKKGASFWMGIVNAVISSLVALLFLLLSVPLWLIPPLILLVPPLIWGWLTYRIMSFDVLANHASKEERKKILKDHKNQLIVMGVICGYLSTAPSVVWSSGLLIAIAFWVLIPLAMWIYTAVFCFSALWFCHYCLTALQALRAQSLENPAEKIIEKEQAHRPVHKLE